MADAENPPPLWGTPEERGASRETPFWGPSSGGAQPWPREPGQPPPLPSRPWPPQRWQPQSGPREPGEPRQWQPPPSRPWPPPGNPQPWYPPYPPYPQPQWIQPPPPARDLTLAYALLLLLGTFGLHKFYLRENGLGGVYLMLGLLGWATSWLLFGFLLLMPLWLMLLIDIFTLPRQVRRANLRLGQEFPPRAF